MNENSEYTLYRFNVSESEFFDSVKSDCQFVSVI